MVLIKSLASQYLLLLKLIKPIRKITTNYITINLNIAKKHRSKFEPFKDYRLFLLTIYLIFLKQ